MLGRCPLGGQALVPQAQHQFLLPGIDRRQRPGGPAEQEIGQAGIADQCGAVQIGADHPAGIGAFCAVPVADAGQHGGERFYLGAAPGHALMVLETGQPRHAQRRIDIGRDLADAAPVTPAAADVEQPQSGDRLSFGPAELGADDLVPGTDGQDDRAPADRRGQSAAGPEPPGGQDLR